jgi:hypothetical protein
MVVGASNSRTHGVTLVATWEPSQKGGFLGTGAAAISNLLRNLLHNRGLDEVFIGQLHKNPFCRIKKIERAQARSFLSMAGGTSVPSLTLL